MGVLLNREGWHSVSVANVRLTWPGRKDQVLTVDCSCLCAKNDSLSYKGGTSELKGCHFGGRGSIMSNKPLFFASAGVTIPAQTRGVLLAASEKEVRVRWVEGA